MNQSPFQVVFPDADPPSIDVIQRLLDDGKYPELAVTMFEDAPEDPSEWLRRIGSARGMLLSWALPDEALVGAPELEVISFLGTGLTDHLNVQLAEERGIALRRVVGYGNYAVAEHALAMLLTAWRDIPALDREVRKGAWPPHQAQGLQGARLAVLGLGGIGRTMAHLAAAVGMDVVGWTRSHAQGERERDGVKVVALEEALSGADAVSLHLPYLPETHHLITEQHLDLLRPGAILVNTARGSVLDSAALTNALDKGQISRAALDVFEKEPLRPNHPWLTRSDVILTPHVAFNTTDSFEALMVGALDNLYEYVLGRS